jgi:ligand-binding sensor protein
MFKIEPYLRVRIFVDGNGRRNSAAGKGVRFAQKEQSHDGHGNNAHECTQCGGLEYINTVVTAPTCHVDFFTWGVSYLGQIHGHFSVKIDR